MIVLICFYPRWMYDEKAHLLGEGAMEMFYSTDRARWVNVLTRTACT